MSSFAVAHLSSVTMGPSIVEYLTRIDATLEPYGGRFVVHGGDTEVLEGHWPGHLIVIEFPDRAHARSWYASPAYRRILRLRTDNSDGAVILVDAVAQPHRATDVLTDPPVIARS
jgi:uncharacterized protein (DUF1330 family)